MKKIKLAAATAFLTIFYGITYAAAQHNHGGGGHGGGHQENAAAAVCPLRVRIFDPALKNTDNGVEIILTAKEMRNVARLRELAASYFSSKDEMDKNCPARVAGSKTSVEETDGGVKITITALSPQVIKTIQAAAAYACKREESIKTRQFKTYVCPMGEYQSSKPGKCPVCGMELKEKT